MLWKSLLKRAPTIKFFRMQKARSGGNNLFAVTDCTRKVMHEAQAAKLPTCLSASDNMWRGGLVKDTEDEAEIREWNARSIPLQPPAR